MIAGVIGGASSKKSEYAESMVMKLKSRAPVYLATMINSSAADQKIVDRHRLLRQGKGFISIEKPVRLYETVLPDCDTVLLEDVSNLCANEFFSYKEPVSAGEAYYQMIKGIDCLAASAENLIIVTGNVFEDGIVYDEFTESYIKTFAQVNKHIARICDVFIEMINGYPLFYKGSSIL